MIIIADTNIFISAIVFGSKLNLEILEYWSRGELKLAMSQELIEGIILKLRHFKQPMEIQELWKDMLTSKALIFNPKTKITVYRDQKDNFLLELAQESSADFLITGDKDLLDLNHQMWENTKIVKPEFFIGLIRE